MRRRTFLVGAGAAAAAGIAAACSTQSSRREARSSSSTSSTSTSTTTKPVPTVPTGFVSRADGPAPSVALTFHTNGDPGLVTQLLDLVRERQTHVTFFVVGTWLDANPEFAPRLVADGHELANHTYTHPSGFDHQPVQVMADEITRCRDTLARLADQPGRWFRPSGTTNGVDDPGSDVLAQAAAAGYPTVIGYDVDPADYADPGASAVIDRTLSAVRPGSIVSLHTGHQGTVDALPAILDRLASAGLTPVTVSHLFAGR